MNHSLAVGVQGSSSLVEAGTTSERQLSGDKAARIVAAMRASVAERGTAGSTFDQVAGAAGVSRGLLHPYFGTKERLLVEVVRHDCDVRTAALRAALAEARSADDVIAVLVAGLDDVVRNDAGFATLLFELFVPSRRHADVADEFGELLRRLREQMLRLLADGERDFAGAIAAGVPCVRALVRNAHE